MDVVIESSDVIQLEDLQISLIDLTLFESACCGDSLLNAPMYPGESSKLPLS